MPPFGAGHESEHAPLELAPLDVVPLEDAVPPDDAVAPDDAPDDDAVPPPEDAVDDAPEELAVLPELVAVPLPPLEDAVPLPSPEGEGLLELQAPSPTTAAAERMECNLGMSVLLVRGIREDPRRPRVDPHEVRDVSGVRAARVVLDEELRAVVRVLDAAERHEGVDLARVALVGERAGPAKPVTTLSSQRDDRGRIGAAHASHQRRLRFLRRGRGGGGRLRG
jgi:hypothetical protein